MENRQDTFDIEKEYAKNPDLKREDVKLLREWIETQTKFPEISGKQFREIKNIFGCYRNCF